MCRDGPSDHLYVWMVSPEFDKNVLGNYYDSFTAVYVRGRYAGDRERICQVRLFLTTVLRSFGARHS